MDLQCEIKEQAPQPVLSIRTKTRVEELPALMGQVFQSVALYLGEQGQVPAGPPFAAYYNMDMTALDVEVGFPVATALPGKGEIQPGTLPGGRVATVVYTGPYEQMKSAYEELAKHVQASGAEPTGVSYEIYLSDPSQVPADQLMTQILFPLK